MDVSIELLAALFLVAALAGWVDTLAGGGGLITVPALLLTGMPPVMALGTNKLQGVVGTATASFYLLRSRALVWHNIKALMFFASLAVFVVAGQLVSWSAGQLVSWSGWWARSWH